MVRLQVFSINRRPRLTVPSMFKMSTWDVKEPHNIRKEYGVKFPVLSFSLVNVAGSAVMF